MDGLTGDGCEGQLDCGLASFLDKARPGVGEVMGLLSMDGCQRISGKVRRLERIEQIFASAGSRDSLN